MITVLFFSLICKKRKSPAPAFTTESRNRGFIQSLINQTCQTYITSENLPEKRFHKRILISPETGVTSSSLQ